MVSSEKLAIMLLITLSGFCFIITAVGYYSIYFTVKHHRNQIQVQQVHVAQNVQNSQTESAARQRKSAVSTFYVFLVFLVCNLPEYCVAVARLISHGLYFYSVTLVFLNSSLNPVIYCWKMKHIRHAMIDVLRNIFPRQTQADV